MFKVYTPYAHAKNIYSLSIDFLKKHNIKVLFLDLDNTLDSYRQKTPSDKAKQLISKFKEAGFDIYILSNNTGNRVKNYASELGVNFVSSIRKPFAFKINRFIKEHSLNKEDIMLIGDQLMTDVAAGNRAGILTIYLDKLVKEDQPTTRFNRIFERPVRKYLQKKKRLIEWEDRLNGRD